MTPELKLLAFENLMGEVSAALADAVDAMKKGGSGQDEIAAALAELVGLMEKRKAVDLGELVKAVQQLRLEHTIVVHPTPPTPITVLPAPVQFLPAPDVPDTVWEVRIEGHYGAPARLMTIRKQTR